MPEINIPVASQIFFTALVSAMFTGIFVFIFQKVFVERWLLRNLELFKADLQRTIQNEARQLRFTERQMEESYSPMIGCLKKIQASLAPEGMNAMEEFIIHGVSSKDK